MPRPLKLNETPTAPFNLREVGPLRETDLHKRLGKSFRLAAGAQADTRATVDPGPCPDCGALVEWAATGRREPPDGAVIRYAYARCRGKAQHRWGLRSHPTPPPPTLVAKFDPTTLPQPPTVLASWIDSQIKSLEAQISKLSTIKQLSSELQIPKPRPSNGRAA